MSLANLKLSDFNSIAKLLTQKHDLLRKVSAIDQELGQFDTDPAGNGHAPTVRRGRPPGSGRKARQSVVKRGRKGARRGKMKEEIVAILKEAGKQGVHIKEIVKKTGAKDPNVRAWFYVTGKKVKNIKTVAPATYAWVD